MRSPTFAAVACTSDEDDDRVLVERYLSGDRDAFTSLVVRYQRPIYNAAFWVLRRHEDAHDISQTVFLKVAERADEYDPKYKFFSWIYRIAVNESLNLLRRNRHEDELADDVDIAGDESAGPERQASAAQLARQLRKRDDDHGDERPAGADAAPFLGMQLRRDGADPGDRREDREVALVRGEAPPARPAQGLEVR